MANPAYPTTRKVLTAYAAFRVCEDFKDFMKRFGHIKFAGRGRNARRAVAPWLPNKKGFRYERGHMVPRT
jgi:hypothetical protein